MFGTVNHRYVAALGIGAALIVAFVVVSMLMAGRWPVAAIVLGWLAALTSLLVMLNTDNGYSPAAGAWLTLATTLATAAVGSVDRLFVRAREGAT